MTTSPIAEPRLASSSFAGLWIWNFLGAAEFQILQPLVPLIVVERGGDAALVGLTALAFSLPSFAFRPVLGRAVDRRGARSVAMAGTVVLALIAAVYAIPAVVALFVARIVHGVGWAGFNTGGYSLLGRLAPPGRRGEASGYYSVAQAAAQLLMPGLGVWLYLSLGLPVALLIGSVAAVVALAVLWIARIPEPPWGSASAASATGGLTERSALLPMTLEAVNAATQALFTFFMPVIVLALAIPVESLTVYYPAYGAVLVIGRMVAPRLSDAVGRIPTLVLGVAIALGALLVGAASTTFSGLLLGGCLAALSGAIVTPTHLALTIDRAPPNRMGAAMATFSLGYQVGFGVGGAAWGFLIAAMGPRSPFVVGALIEVAAIGLLVSRSRAKPQPR